MNIHLLPYRNGDAWVCPCGQQFATDFEARLCEHPATRGKLPAAFTGHVPPTEWWTPHDEEILAGELAALSGLPRPAYIERDRDRLVYRPVYVPLPFWRRAGREIGAWIFIVGVALGIILLLSVGGEQTAPPPCPGDPAGCADLPAVTPWTPPPAGRR